MTPNKQDTAREETSAPVLAPLREVEEQSRRLRRTAPVRARTAWLYGGWVFALPFILYGADSVTLPILTWNYLNDGSYGTASALAIVQVIAVGLVVLLLRTLFGADIRARSE